MQCTVNVQQVDKHHDLFKISLARGFSGPDCEQNTLTLETNCTYLVSKHIYQCAYLSNMAGLIALVMNLYICKDGMLLYFLKYDQLPPKKNR